VGQSEGSEPSRLESSGPMREAGATSTLRNVTRLSVVQGCCARPTGGSHGRTIRGPAQRRGGAKLRPRLRGWSRRGGQENYKGRRPVGSRLGGPRCPHSSFIRPLFLNSSQTACSREKATNCVIGACQSVRILRSWPTKTPFSKRRWITSRKPGSASGQLKASCALRA